MRKTLALKLILIILSVSIIPIILVSFTTLFSVHTISGIAAQTFEDITTTSVEDSAVALEAELVRGLREQTISLGNDINQKLHQVTTETSILRDYAEFLYAHPGTYERYPYPSTYSFAPHGPFGSREQNENSWLLVSELALEDGLVPEEVMDEVYLTEWLDPIFRTIARNDQNAVQLYINTRSQITRGMPFYDGEYIWVDGTLEFPTAFNSPEDFDFYYLANETNNPDRKTVWTTLYYDPAGLGWMISSISPVYTGDILKGVVGIDITLDRIISSILDVTVEQTGFAFMLSDQGHLIAFPERAGPFLGFTGTLTGTFHQDEQFRYNMSQHPDQTMSRIIRKMVSGESGIEKYLHHEDQNEYFIGYAPIKETGWSIGVVAPVHEVTAPSRVMSARIEGTTRGSSDQISDQINAFIFNNIIIILLILLAMIPTAYILTRMISNPVQTLIDGARRIGTGELTHRIEVTTHDELEELAGTFNTMAHDLDLKLTELEEVNRELRQMDALKSQFISIASHELRTPLIAMKGYIELLQGRTKGSLTDEQTKMLTIIARNTARLGRIISELLDMSRIEAKKLILNREWFSIAEIIHDVGEELSSSIQKRGHTYQVDIPEKLPQVYADRDRIAQVFINLLGNAIKYTPDNGRITLTAYAREDTVCVEVTDTGIGISPEDIPHIFSGFYQATSVTSHKTGKEEFLAGGTGLGLAIVKGIITAHDGDIIVESYPGKGTTFTVILPLSPSGSEPDRESLSGRSEETEHLSHKTVPLVTEEEQKKTDILERDGATGGTKPPKVLIIDDEPDTLEFMHDLLSDQYTIISANSGATGLKSALSEIPDIILLDAWMPGITGYDVCKALKNNPKTRTIPILIVTAAVGEKEERAAESCGADGYLAKPFENEELLSRIRSFIQKGG